MHQKIQSLLGYLSQRIQDGSPTNVRFIFKIKISTIK